MVNSASGDTDKQCGDVIDKHSYLGPESPKPEEDRAAVIYTQLTDVESECNGLMTYDREVRKISHERGTAAPRVVGVRVRLWKPRP